MVELRTATEDDIPAISALRETVGWSAHPWALRAAMRPPSARFLVALDGSSLVGMGSGVSYGALGFVGNMAVAPTHRRHGLGSEILRLVLSFLEEHGARCIELEATDDGMPLYERHGFAVVGGRGMARVRRGSVPAAVTDARRAGPRDLAALAAYDAPRFGGDRSSLLAVALADPERPLLVAERDAAVAGYAWLRPDHDRLGPWLADDLSVAADLLAAAFALLPDAGVLVTNIAEDNAGGITWLRELGADVSTREGRMRLGDPSAVRRRPEMIFGNVVGALG